MSDDQTAPLADVEEVARLLHIDAKTVRRWTNQRGLPCIRFSQTCVRYNVRDVLQWAYSQGQRLETPPRRPRGGRPRRTATALVEEVRAR